jgi:hypothetical protein
MRTNPPYFVIAGAGTVTPAWNLEELAAVWVEHLADPRAEICAPSPLTSSERERLRVSVLRWLTEV